MAHAQKPDFVFQRNGRVLLNWRWASIQSTTEGRGVYISGSNSGYTIFRSSVKSTGYPLHSPVSPSLHPPVRHRVPSHFNWTLQGVSVDSVTVSPNIASCFDAGCRSVKGNNKPCRSAYLSGLFMSFTWQARSFVTAVVFRKSDMTATLTLLVYLAS
jgi:hypothetical protein